MVRIATRVVVDTVALVYGAIPPTGCTGKATGGTRARAGYPFAGRFFSDGVGRVALVSRHQVTMRRWVCVFYGCVNVLAGGRNCECKDFGLLLVVLLRILFLLVFVFLVLILLRAVVLSILALLLIDGILELHLKLFEPQQRSWLAPVSERGET